MTKTTYPTSASVQNLIGKPFQYCPESGNSTRFFQLLKIEKVGVSKKSNRDYIVAELRDLDDNKVKIRTLLVDNIISNHI